MTPTIKVTLLTRLQTIRRKIFTSVKSIFVAYIFVNAFAFTAAKIFNNLWHSLSIKCYSARTTGQFLTYRAQCANIGRSCQCSEGQLALRLSAFKTLLLNLRSQSYTGYISYRVSQKTHLRNLPISNSDYLSEVGAKSKKVYGTD